MITDFRAWTEEQFTEMAWRYRLHLQNKVDCFTEIVRGFNCRDVHILIAEECLREVPVPVIAKYEGSVSAEDREWYAGCLKPNFGQMLTDAIDECKKLKV